MDNLYLALAMLAIFGVLDRLSKREKERQERDYGKIIHAAGMAMTHLL